MENLTTLLLCNHDFNALLTLLIPQCHSVNACIINFYLLSCNSRVMFFIDSAA